MILVTFGGTGFSPYFVRFLAKYTGFAQGLASAGTSKRIEKYRTVMRPLRTMVSYGADRPYTLVTAIG